MQGRFGPSPFGCIPPWRARRRDAHQSITAPQGQGADAMNSLSLVGNLTRDPVLRFTPDGTAVCDLRVAVDAVGDTPPLYLDLATFGPQAQACAEHLAKGRQI